MDAQRCDIAIVGGGLSGGLIAAALAMHRPELTIRLIEAGSQLGGNHRWNWFASDVSEVGDALLDRFRRLDFEGGYDVGFPGHVRHVATACRSLSSAEFGAGLRRALPGNAVITKAKVSAMDGQGVTLAGGAFIPARAVVDCRGHAASHNLRGGWQTFMGRRVRLDRPHGVEHPVMMDATVTQHGTFRFVRVLPLGAHDIFIEDCYYADSPNLDRRALSARIDAYCNQFGWQGEILGGESGVLPVITGGDFPAYQAEHRIPGIARAGALGGFVHPLTSQTLPQAAEIALAVAREADLPGDQLAAMLETRARQHWRRTKPYRRMGGLLFRAARPEERYRLFERLYRLPQGVIERFHAARSTRFDRARILCARPPVPFGRAMGAMFNHGTPMSARPDPFEDAA